MGASRTSAAGAGQKPEPPCAVDIRAQVERVLDSAPFRSSRRCQALLRHITERALGGDSGALKERTIGVEVFGRPPDYDTNVDPVVRGTAGEVRKKLAQYYQEPGHRSELRIELHPGSYVPEFNPGEVAAAPARPARMWRLPSIHIRPRTAAIAGAVLALLALAGLAAALWPRPTAADRFWGPVLDAPGAVLFSIPQPRAYNFRSDARQKEIETRIESMAPGAWDSSRELIPLNQLVPMWDRYLAAGDVACLLKLAIFFEKRGKPFRIRAQASTSYSDLREQPVILIGYFNNEWTLRAVGEMRYTFYKDYQGLEMVRDRNRPEMQDWKLLNSWPHWKIDYDYAIVSRVFDQDSRRMAVVAAGITHFGTEGAGEFLTDPESFSEILPRLPADWPKRNLQIVLRIPVVRGASGHPHVLATHVW